MSRLDSLDLLLQRTIAVFLTAKDKILFISKLSHKWHNFIFSGFAWQNLFDFKNDPTWNPLKFSPDILSCFSHLKGVNQLFITASLTNYDMLNQFATQFNELYIQQDGQKSFMQHEVFRILKNIQLSRRMKRNPLSITQLDAAVYWNQIAQIQNILAPKNKIQIEAILEQRYPIDYALLNGRYQAMQLLVKHISQKRLHQAIFQSIRMDQFKIFILLFNITGNNSKIKGEQDQSMINQVFRQNPINIEMAKVLLECDESPNEGDGFQTPLTRAIESENVQLVKILFQYGAQISPANIFNQTALHRSIKINNLQITETILKEADKQTINVQDHRQQTAFHYVAWNGYVELAKLLVKYGADIHCLNQYLETSLHLALRKSKLEMVKYLINEGININFPNQDNQTALDYACKLSTINSKLIFKELVDAGGVSQKLKKDQVEQIYYKL